MYAPDTEVIAEADGVASGVEMLKKEKPDLVFLDVEMKDGTGFDLLALYGIPDFKVAFVTGHDAYAIKAFKFSAIDYLLKPVDPDELVATLNKAREALLPEEQKTRLRGLLDNQSSDRTNKIVLRDAETVYLVAIDEILRCESDTNYTYFYLTDGRKIVVSRTLKEFQQLFEDMHFLRVHQSHLINLRHFDRYDKREGGQAFMKDGIAVPVSVRKRESLLSALERL